MELLSVSCNGINSGQAAINIVCDNISNAMNPDYCRKSAIFSTVPGQSGTRGMLSGGAVVEEAKRINNIFINQMERQETSHYSYVAQSSQLMEKLDKITSESSANINGSIGNFFDGLLKIDSTQNEQVTRAEVFGQLKSWFECLRNFDNQLDDMKKRTNDLIMQSVSDINSAISNISTLNKDIEYSYLNHHTLPSDLLDRREREINQLNACIGVEINQDDKTGRIDIRLAKGYPLINGSDAFYLQAVPTDHQSSVVNVHYKNDSADGVLLSSNDLKNGSLKANIDFYHGGLSQVLEGLHNITYDYANQLNKINTAGYDYYGDPGKDIFINSSQIKAMKFNLVDGNHLALSTIGLHNTLSNNKETLSPEDHSQHYNNEFERDDLNLKSFLELNSQVSGGDQNNTFKLINLTSDIGSKTRVLKNELQIADKNLAQISYDRKNYQGVDVDTEHFNLSFFTKYYQANVRAMQAAQSTFDMLIKL